MRLGFILACILLAIFTPGIIPISIGVVGTCIWLEFLKDAKKKSWKKGRSKAVKWCVLRWVLGYAVCAYIFLFLTGLCYGVITF